MLQQEGEDIVDRLGFDEVIVIQDEDDLTRKASTRGGCGACRALTMPLAKVASAARRAAIR
jgi:hypothetical protein